ncbi:MAG: hypothetical protein JST87_12505 [Bacteroidetes bacterium]|nr:hypothetical protein [Bacteroidota bacterium]
MKILLISLFLIISATCFCQKIEKYYDYQWKETSASSASFYAIIEKTDSGWHRTDFYIDGGSLQMEGFYKDSACKISHGRFSFFYPNRKLQTIGMYKDGKKQGVWLSFYSDGLMSDSLTYDNGTLAGICMQWYRTGYASDSSNLNEDGSGTKVSWFDNGNVSFAGYFSQGHRPHGKWKFFHRNGNLSETEVYDHGRLLEKQYYNENQKLLQDTTNKDKPAEFPGGLKAWQIYLERKLQFPEQFKITNSDMVVIVVDATINEDGKLSDIETRVPFHPAFNKIAMDVMKRSPTWIPAIDHNRKVKYHISQPIMFTQ